MSIDITAVVACLLSWVLVWTGHMDIWTALVVSLVAARVELKVRSLR